MQKLDELYSGKAKTVYNTDDPDFLVLHYRNDTSAFDGVKLAKLDRKGKVNNHFNGAIMQRLAENGIETHFEKILSDEESIVKRLEMFPIECVVRNIAAGHLCKNLGIEEGINLNPPTFEFFLKNDALHDPMINEYHIKTFGWASDDDVKQMRELSFKINNILKPMFADAGMLLVDYKLEFGKFKDRIVLGDEFTPDGCRIWDAETREKLDKDRFRKDLGQVVESYELVAQRLGIEV